MPVVAHLDASCPVSSANRPSFQEPEGTFRPSWQAGPDRRLDPEGSVCFSEVPDLSPSFAVPFDEVHSPEARFRQEQAPSRKYTELLSAAGHKDQLPLRTTSHESDHLLRAWYTVTRCGSR